MNIPVAGRVRFAAVIFGMSVAAPAGADTGTLQICRAPRIVGLHQQDTIGIPAGATVADVGTVKGPNDGDNYRPVWLETTIAAVLRKGVSCVRVPARIGENTKRFTVKVADGRLYRPSGGSSNPRDRWMMLGDFQITVVDDFK